MAHDDKHSRVLAEDVIIEGLEVEKFLLNLQLLIRLLDSLNDRVEHSVRLYDLTL